MNTNQINEMLLNFLAECVRIRQMSDDAVALKQLDDAIDDVLKNVLDWQEPSSDELGIDYEDGL